MRPMTTYPAPSVSMYMSVSSSSEYPRLRDKFIRRLMKHSKKSVSTQILDESLEFAYRSLQSQVQDQRSSPNLPRYQSDKNKSYLLQPFIKRNLD